MAKIIIIIALITMALLPSPQAGMGKRRAWKDSPFCSTHTMAGCQENPNKLKMGFPGPEQMAFVKDDGEPGAKHIKLWYLWIDCYSEVNCTLLNDCVKSL